MTSDFLSTVRFHVLRLRLLLLTILISGAVTLLCAWLAEQYLTERIAIIGSFAGFVLAHNPGIAFSITFPPLLQHLLIAAALVAVIIVALRSNQTRPSAVGFGFIIGGALGNVVDRIPDGLVTDFLLVGTFPIFNTADMFITVGVGLLFLHHYTSSSAGEAENKRMTSAFLPAARFHLLTPLYEAAVQPFMHLTWKKIVQEVSKRAPQNGTVVDLGCGPGSILRMLRVERPDLQLIGIDIDPAIVSLAQKKARNKNITFHVASIERTPLKDGSADVVLSSLMFHHLPTPTKAAAFQEAKRLLKPKSAFLLCDFSVPQNRVWLSLRWWKYLEPEIEPQFRGQLLDLGKQAGAKVDTLFTSYGCISLHAFTLGEKE